MAAQFNRTHALPVTPPKEELEVTESKIDFLAHPVLRAGLAAPTPPKTPEVSLEKPLSSDVALPTPQDFQASKFSKVPEVAKSAVVSFVKAEDPPVTYKQVFFFIIWVAWVFIKQIWRDVKSFDWYRPTLATDFMTHYMYLPAGRVHPRLLTSGAHNRMTVRKIPGSMVDWDSVEDLTTFPEREVINVATSNYAGFSRLEHNIEAVMKEAINTLPWAPAPPALEQRLRKTCAEYMGFEACVTAPSGFGTNLVAFESIANVAKEQGRQMVFLCDGDSHNSMLTGCFYQKGATVRRFEHNDISDLEFKLRMYREQAPSAFICVAVEGIYSMEGSVSPAPAILALKKLYKFCLLVDEAHSFMSYGSLGKGSFNRWQDLGYDCPYDGADVMTFTFSKGVSSTGGFALASGIHGEALVKQSQSLASRGVESLSTVTLLRFLSILMKTKLVEEKMRITLEKSEYVANKLKEAGLSVLSASGSPMICFPVGTPRQIVLFHKYAMEHDLATIGGVPPATPVWGCRVRLAIFASTTWPDIYRLLTTTISTCLKIHVNGAKHIDIDRSLLDKTDIKSPLAESQSRAVDAELLQYVKTLSNSYKPAITHKHGAEREVKAAAIEGLQRYSIGPGSARWYYGTFDVFVALERKLARMYPSINKQCGKTRGMIWSDTELGMGTSLVASVIPLASAKMTHLVFVDSKAPKSVIDAVKMHKPIKSVQIHFYDRVSDIPEMLNQLGGPKTHLTIYLQTASGSQVLDLPSVFGSQVLKANKVGSMTLYLDDRHGLGKLGPRSLGYLDLMEHEHGENFLKDTFKQFKGEVKTIVAGSFFEAFGHSGGYLTGHATTVESLTWHTRGYLFSAPPLPMQAKMTIRTIEMLEDGCAKK